MKKKNFFAIVRNIPLSPLLFAESSVFTLFFHNIKDLILTKLLIPFLIVFLFTFLVSLFFRFVLHTKYKGDIFTSVLMILFFSYTDIVSLTGNFHWHIGSLYIDQNHFFITLLTLILLCLFILIKRTQKKLQSLNKLFLIISSLSVLIPTAGIINYQISQRLHPVQSSRLNLPDLSASSSKVGYLPDVYYIVPDSYASQANMSKYFSLDNSSFMTYLKNKGFYVATDSTSNYPTTLLSLSASLNMEYTDYLSSYKNSSDVSIAAPLIANNNVLKMLRSLHYKFYQMGSWWWPTTSNQLADDNYNIQKLNQVSFDGFTNIILESTMVNPFLEKLFPQKIIGESIEDKRTIILYQFNSLPKVAQLPGPKFVFTHMIAPHGPYVFNSDCSSTTPEQTDARSEEINYSNQVNCINIKLKETIDKIIQESPKPPIILLQTDEGAKFIAEKLSPSESWQNATDEQLKMKFPILSAYYLPGVSSETLYSSMTPVNSFRMIFNLYFSANFPLLPDRNYIYLDKDHLYDFKDVTEKIH